MTNDDFGPAYYARRADALGWGAAHAPDPEKLAFLRAHAIGERVLDIACGPGVYAAALATAQRRVIGLDFSAALLRSGRAHHREWWPVAASGMRLPLRDKAADCACLLSVLEHVDDAALLAETVRVTRRRIIVQVPLAEPPLLEQMGLLFSHWSDRSHLRTYSEDSLRALAAQAGWRVTVYQPAYHRDLQELFVRGLRAPDVVRNALRAALKPLRPLGTMPAAEAFAVLEPR